MSRLGMSGGKWPGIRMQKQQDKDTEAGRSVAM